MAVVFLRYWRKSLQIHWSWQMGEFQFSIIGQTTFLFVFDPKYSDISLFLTSLKFSSEVLLCVWKRTTLISGTVASELAKKVRWEVNDLMGQTTRNQEPVLFSRRTHWYFNLCQRWLWWSHSSSECVSILMWACVYMASFAAYTLAMCGAWLWVPERAFRLFQDSLNKWQTWWI